MLNPSPTPKVSVVVPAYQQADYLAATLDSVLAQTFTDIELVVADHSSSDATPEVVQRYRDVPGVRVLSPTPSGGGAPANWQRVTEAATGEYLKLLPGDDVISPDAIARQVEALDSQPRASLTCARRTIIDGTGRVLKSAMGMPRRLWGVQSGREVISATLKSGRNLFGEPGCVLMRRQLLTENGYWDPTDPYLIDQASYSRVILAGCASGLDKVVVIGDPLASFRVNKGQWSVALVGAQATQAISFTRRIVAQEPDLLSPQELRMAEARVRAMALARRGAYGVLSVLSRDAAS